MLQPAWIIRKRYMSTGVKYTKVQTKKHLFCKQNKYTSNFSSNIMYMSTSFGTKTIEMYRKCTKVQMIAIHVLTLCYVGIQVEGLSICTGALWRLC